MSNWYKWESIEAFDAWHEIIKAELGLPINSVNIEGIEQPDATVTDSYTQPFIIAENDIRAMVEDNYAEGLTASHNPIIDERVSS